MQAGNHFIDLVRMKSRRKVHTSVQSRAGFESVTLRLEAYMKHKKYLIFALGLYLENSKFLPILVFHSQ